MNEAIELAATQNPVNDERIISHCQNAEAGSRQLFGIFSEMVNLNRKNIPETDFGSTDEPAEIK